MVMCNMELPRPPPPPLPSGGFPIHRFETSESIKSRNSQGFRLLENAQEETASIYSAFKQKIDAMFAETEGNSITRKNSVQARIEKMFTDVAEDGGLPVQETGAHAFSVDYMGSVPLLQKVSSLAGLQEPLKTLYFKYKKEMKAKSSQEVTGRLEISSNGLKVQYQGPQGDIEQINSFPTIAVWSAVKFVLHEEHEGSYAFLPLITDPDNIDKQTLFKVLDEEDKEYIESTVHSPLFAVVMRKIGVPKLLECHGFVCQTSEDAIVAAATLYKSLMSHMKAKDRKPKTRGGVACMSTTSSIANISNSGGIPVRPPRKKRSTTSSIASEYDINDTSDTQPLLPEPSKSPKKSTKNRRAPPAPSIESNTKPNFDEILPYEEPINSKKPDGNNNNVKDIKPNLGEKWNTYKSEQQKQITAEIKQVMSESSTKGLKRVQSVRKRNEDGIAPDNTGDILTKVTIPRSGSFLNAGGLTRYKSKITKINGQAAGGSPLGFNELFNEFRLQEGLHSVDEILGVIIDPEGMSFNDLKPIYKEFLLKLSMTLTKDELYQRSKAIMRRHRKKSIKRVPARNHKQKQTLVVNQKFKGLKHIFRKTVKTQLEKKLNKGCTGVDLDQVNPHKKLQESSISTSSYDTRQFRPKQSADTPKKQSYKKKASSRRERASTSEESDFFSLKRSKGRTQSSSQSLLQNRNSSSGYVSCSECSYDSDTCTCVSADKCYCSLGNKHTRRPHNRGDHHHNCKKACRTEEKCYCSWQQDDLSYCGCDTDSCTESNKCYCPVGAYEDKMKKTFINGGINDRGTILEQLRRRGFIPSVESVPITPSHRKLCKSNSNTKSSKSLEYMPNPSEEYYEKMQTRLRHNETSRSNRSRKSYSTDSALNYELFALSNRHMQDLYNRAVYGKAFSECGQPYCKQASLRSCNSNALYDKRAGKTVRSTAISVDRSGACTEALSVKKSAEIAALFADIKLSQTTDITHMLPPDFDRGQTRMGVDNRPHSRMGSYARSERNMEKKALMPNNSRLHSSQKSRNQLYSTRNGLYTIQSQSDESRRSSVCENGRKREKPSRQDNDYFNVEPEGRSPVSQNIEDSLGYLP